MPRARRPRRVNEAAVNVLLNLRHDALDVRVSLVFELADMSRRGSHLVEMTRAQRHADVSAEQFDDLGLVSIGYGAHHLNVADGGIALSA